jgi:octaprenyl-diphosphate synthase
MVSDGNLEILRILSDASAIIAQGEVKQMTTSNNLETTTEDYINVIGAKTAALFAAACEVGPVIANESKDVQTALREYGYNLGIAFQIADDILDYSASREKLGKTVGDDFFEGKVTAPVLFALQSANADQRAFWARTIEKKEQEHNDLELALKLMTECGAFTRSQELANEYAQKAIKALEPVKPSPIKDHLSDLASYAVSREF